jgi:murein DD-endopeptidase MepM/ murein hydrolase activator NlpD
VPLRLHAAPLRRAALAALVCSIPVSLAAQEGASGGCASSFELSWSPERPVPGTFFTVRLAGGAPEARPQGRIGSEPLHFAPDSAGGWQALAPAPIDARKSLGVVLACAGAPSDSATRAIPVGSASYPLERLTVAPQFSQKPDSALAARQRREAERAAAVSARAHETPRLWTEPFRAPRESRITSGYGRGRQFNGTVTSRHMGTDYAGAVGAPIRAANRGVVRLVDRFFLGGNVVYVDHGEGLVTAYLHLSKHRVAEGDTVARGQVVGEVGATGRVTGPHLHWIVRYGAVSLDPLSLLRVTSRSAPTIGGASPAGAKGN